MNQEANCIFCKIINKEIPAKIVLEDRDIVAFEDANPSAPIHILMVPKEHIATIDDLEKKDTLLAGKIILFAQKLARKLQISEKGYRLIFNVRSDGGQTVNHIHLHLIGGAKLKERVDHL
jgi:histidine triad (HIT) family protein